MTGLQYLNFICDIYEVPSKMRKQNFEKLASAFQVGPHLNNSYKFDPVIGLVSYIRYIAIAFKSTIGFNYFTSCFKGCLLYTSNRKSREQNCTHDNPQIWECADLNVSTAVITVSYTHLE